MTKEEAIKYLQQLYPNGGHCWLDEQRIEAINMAVKALQEEPVAPKVLEDMLNAKTAAESLGISQEEHDRIVDEFIYGKEPELVDVDDLPNKEEEPVSNPIDFEKELYKAFGQVKDFTLGVQIAKRFYDMGRKYHVPVSEDLEEAAHEYADLRMSNYETAFYAFMSGANWQKEKDMQKFLHSETATFTREEFDAEMEEVRKQTQEQMMNDAVEGVITFDYYRDGDKTYGCIAHDSFCLEDMGLKDGDKVKLIIIKED